MFLGVFKLLCFLIIIHWLLVLFPSEKDWSHQCGLTVSMITSLREWEKMRAVGICRYQATVTATKQGWSLEIPCDGSTKRQNRILFKKQTNTGSGLESWVLLTKLEILLFWIGHFSFTVFQSWVHIFNLPPVQDSLNPYLVSWNRNEAQARWVEIWTKRT